MNAFDLLMKRSKKVSDFTQEGVKKSVSDVKSEDVKIPFSSSFRHVLYFDGCSRGNPGLSGAGAVLYEDGKEISSRSVFIGNKETNNVAEYVALINGLEMAIEKNIQELVVKGDSSLVIKQMKREWKVKHADMMHYFTQARELDSKIKSVFYQYVPRERNTVADALANRAVDDRLKTKKVLVNL
tara:strand:+ start:8312 stop:8863 length:552 start_codon:yes stop_codon:yes gene_type:complete